MARGPDRRDAPYRPMKASIQRPCDQSPQLSAVLGTITQTADEIEELALPELRQRIDDVHASLARGLLGHQSQPTSQDDAVVSRLGRKLEALRERMLYSYFGLAELWSLQAVLYDLAVIIERQLGKEGETYSTLPDAEPNAPKLEVSAG
jgi:hypothetical protein